MKVTIECDDCGGTGTRICPRCDGDLFVECSECEGDGELLCGNCKGKGCGVCDDEGTYECDICEGDGGDDCTECDAQVIVCKECGGEGVIEFDDAPERARRYEAIIPWLLDVVETLADSQTAGELADKHGLTFDRASEIVRTVDVLRRYFATRGKDRGIDVLLDMDPENRPDWLDFVTQ